MTVAIIDYGMGNVRSVFNALDFVGADPVITCEPTEINNASHIVLPGVGAFGDAMKNLIERGLIEVLGRQVLEKGKPFLGICLGMQLLAEESNEHGQHEGLGWFDASVVRFELKDAGDDESSDGNILPLKVPHMGWNSIEPVVDHPLLENLPLEQCDFYFVHSFHVDCRDKASVAASCHYGRKFTSAIHKDNIFATQFHPEKSQDNGLQVLTNFTAWAA